MAHKLRLVITINNNDLPDLLSCLKIYADDVQVGLHEKYPKETKENQKQKRTRRSRASPKTMSAREFILTFADQHKIFSVSKQLVPEGLSLGYQKNTLYSTCTRLAKAGMLKRSLAGSYQLVSSEEQTES